MNARVVQNTLMHYVKNTQEFKILQQTVHIITTRV